jgi:hypothetical protein
MDLKKLFLSNTLPKKGLLCIRQPNLPIVFAVFDAVVLVYAAIANQLGANPAEALIGQPVIGPCDFCVLVCLLHTASYHRFQHWLVIDACWDCLCLFLWFSCTWCYGWLEMSLDPSACEGHY